MTDSTLTVPARRRLSLRGRLLAAVLVTVVSVAALWTVLRAGSIAAGQGLLDLGTSKQLPLSELPLIREATLREGASGGLADVDILLRALSSASLLVEAVTVSAAMVFLVRALTEIGVGRAFGAVAAQRWRALAISLIVGGVLTGLLNAVAFAYLAGNSSPIASNGSTDFLGGDYVTVSLDFPHWPLMLIIAGLVASALLAAFRSGAQLERDIDGVI